MTQQLLKFDKDSRKLFGGLWHNQHGSEAEFSIGARGEVEGVFRIQHPVRGTVSSYPISGFAQGDIIVFAVMFPEFGCGTSWAGQVGQHDANGDAETLYTLWHMTVRVGLQSKNSLWKSMLCGADNFQRGASKEHPLTNTAASHPLWCSEDWDSEADA
ncbi:MAG TPA: avidin/streptavidin family protein [Oculatellaceae cyanobacterium]